MPARGGLAAGPCTFEPNARRDKVRRHLHERHRTSDREAAVLMAGTAPITRGEDMAVDGPRRREGMHGSEQPDDGESDEELDGGRELEDEREHEQLDLLDGSNVGGASTSTSSSSSSSSSSSGSSNPSPSSSFLAAKVLRAGGEDNDGGRERGPVRESFLVGAIDEEEEGELAT